MLRFTAFAALGLLCACSAMEPVRNDPSLGDKPIAIGNSRLVFLRTQDSRLYVARNARVSLDGSRIGAVAYGSFFTFDAVAGNHGLRADLWDMPGRCELFFTAVAGETYFFQVDPRFESFLAFTTGDLAAQFLSGDVLVSILGGASAVAADSYGETCGGAFRIYPVDAGTAISLLDQLRLTK